MASAEYSNYLLRVNGVPAVARDAVEEILRRYAATFNVDKTLTRIDLERRGDYSTVLRRKKVL